MRTRLALASVIVLVILIGVYSTVLGDEESTPSPSASTVIEELIDRDDEKVCDDIGRVTPLDAVIERDDPRYYACLSNGFQAHLRCQLDPDTTLFQTVTVDCSMYLSNVSDTPLEVKLSNLTLESQSGDTYPVRRRGIGLDDESPLTKDERYGARGWAVSFDVPQDEPLPMLVRFTVGSDDAEVVFIIETLSEPNL